MGPGGFAAAIRTGTYPVGGLFSSGEHPTECLPTVLGETSDCAKHGGGLRRDHRRRDFLLRPRTLPPASSRRCAPEATATATDVSHCSAAECRPGGNKQCASRQRGNRQRGSREFEHQSDPTSSTRPEHESDTTTRSRDRTSPFAPFAGLGFR